MLSKQKTLQKSSSIKEPCPSNVDAKGCAKTKAEESTQGNLDKFLLLLEQIICGQFSFV